MRQQRLIEAKKVEFSRTAEQQWNRPQISSTAAAVSPTSPSPNLPGLPPPVDRRKKPTLLQLAVSLTLIFNDYLFNKKKMVFFMFF
jgi:hypothetical protein